mgnify:FL=1
MGEGMRRGKTFVSVVVFLGVLGSGCAVGAFTWPWQKKDEDPREEVAEEQARPRPKRGEVPVTYLDSLNRGREMVLRREDFVRSGPRAAEPGSAGAAGGATTEGFRVQCFATSMAERARQEKKRLSTRIPFPVYLIFEDPYYKLLVGDFTRRSDARAAQADLMDMGYDDAWIVGTPVNVKR